jgi:hypothetical protein
MIKIVYNVLLNCIIILLSVFIQKIIYRLFNLSYNLILYWGSILIIFFIISSCIQFTKLINNKNKQ